MTDICSEDGECREFIVIPPEGDHFDDPIELMRIQDALDERFPTMKFIVSISGPVRYEDFAVVPVLGVAGGADPKPMLRPPAIDLLEDIATCLAQFTAGNRPLLN
ncbi:hypothetical protein PV773_24495 [Mesorhizobium sp. CC13]|uniref:hypothetical protein n=1 Tax=Mesorhizobium sp. CC13 TaxID=3029194 RepID=UPI003266D338